jgi:hypothetical protein
MSKVEQLAGRVDHIERLLTAFGGSIEGWSFNGKTGEQDPSGLGAVACACGHRPIRQLFFWEKDGQCDVVTGCVCVENVPGLDPSSVERLHAKIVQLKAEKAEAERRAKEASAAAEVQALLVEFHQIYNLCFAKLLAHIKRNGTGGWLDGCLYGERREAAWFREKKASALNLTTRRGQISRLRGLIKRLKGEEG